MQDFRFMLETAERRRRQNEREAHWCAVGACFMSWLALFLALSS